MSKLCHFRESFYARIDGWRLDVGVLLTSRLNLKPKILSVRKYCFRVKHLQKLTKTTTIIDFFEVKFPLFNFNLLCAILTELLTRKTIKWTKQ